MDRGRKRCICNLAVWILLTGVLPCARGNSASLCLHLENGCHVVGSALHARIRLDAGVTTVVSGQTTVQYDPNRLEFVAIAPGNTCDPTSPFVVPLFQVVDVAGGLIHFATSIQPGGLGATGQTTLACATFKIKAGVPGQLCLISAPNPYETRLSNNLGLPVFINNSAACPTSSPPPAFSCAHYVTSLNCVCPGGPPPDCTLLTDECNIGYCSGQPAQCTAAPQDGGSCDDENPCTHPDKCANGFCIGTNCPDPSLCVVSTNGCHVQGSLARFRVVLGAGVSVITSGQFTIRYDPAALDFLSIQPGDHCDAGSPFTNEIFESVNEGLGRVQYAVGIAPGIGTGTSGPATMACLTFLILDGSSTEICMVDAGNPFVTELADDMGHRVHPDNGDTCHPHRSLPVMSCAALEVDASCDCPNGAPDCSWYTDDCNIGVCVEPSAHCEGAPTNDGLACIDDYQCSSNEICVNGRCLASDCDNPSLCLVGGSSCPTLGGLYHVIVNIGAGDDMIVSGEFTLRYNPLALDFYSIVPGVHCDPASPFAVELFRDVDENEGIIRYAAGIDLAAGNGTMGPAALACLSFVILNDTTSRVCLTPGANPFFTRLSNNMGQPIEIYNAHDCPLPGSSTDLSCLPIEVINNCVCPGGVADCSHLNDACNVGYCDGPPKQCRVIAINDGGDCDDGNPCTTLDLCHEGVCVGSGCESPSLCVVADENCLVNRLKRVRIVMGAGDPFVVGGSFVLNYAPSVVRFLDVSPGNTCDPASPFMLEIHENVNEAAGTIFYAVGIDLFMNNPGTQGPATLACLTFELLAFDENSVVCLLTGDNPMFTMLVDANGFPVPVDNSKDCFLPGGGSLLACDEVCQPVPTASTWGLIVFGLLLITAARLRFPRTVA